MTNRTPIPSLLVAASLMLPIAAIAQPAFDAEKQALGDQAISNLREIVALRTQIAQLQNELQKAKEPAKPEAPAEKAK